MNRLSDLRKRIDALPGWRATDYRRELDALAARQDNAAMTRLEFKVRRAEYLLTGIHHGPTAGLRVQR